MVRDTTCMPSSNGFMIYGTWMYAAIYLLLGPRDKTVDPLGWKKKYFRSTNQSFVVGNYHVTIIYCKVSSFFLGGKVSSFIKKEWVIYRKFSWIIYFLKQPLIHVRGHKWSFFGVFQIRITILYSFRNSFLFWSIKFLEDNFPFVIEFGSCTYMLFAIRRREYLSAFAEYESFEFFNITHQSTQNYSL